MLLPHSQFSPELSDFIIPLLEFNGLFQNLNLQPQCTAEVETLP